MDETTDYANDDQPADDVATPDAPSSVSVEREDEKVDAEVAEGAPTQTKSLTDVAKEVYAGDWGEGEVRRQALLDAGWNPNEVKAEMVRLANED